MGLETIKPTSVDTSTLSCNWLDQAYKVGIIKVLQDAVALTALQDMEVQQQISNLRNPKLWPYVGTNTRRHYSLMGEKSMNTGQNLTKQQTKGQDEHTRQNAQNGVCIFLNVNQQHCTNICNECEG